MFSAPMLIERVRKLKRIEDTGNETLKEIKNKFSSKPKSEDYFMKRLPPLEQYLLKAKDIRLSGYSLQRLVYPCHCFFSGPDRHAD